MQTIYAILALMVITVIVFGQKQSVSRAEMLMMRSELATVAEGVMTNRLNNLQSVDFDDLDVWDDSTFTDTVAVGAGELTFELTAEVLPVKRNGSGDFVEDTGANPEYKEIKLNIRGPFETDAVAIRLPETYDDKGVMGERRIYPKETYPTSF